MLRPAFTQSIANDLKKHRSINVFGKEGQGLNQLVEDLIPHIPENTIWVRISMRSYADRYDGFIQDLGRQLKIDLDNDKTITSLINRYLQVKGKKVWFCLEHFDRLALINTDPLYNRDFLDYLNSLKNDSNISLLLTTEKKLATRELYLGEKHISGSILEVDHQTLPELKLTEIENYLPIALEGRPEMLEFLKKDKASMGTLVGKIDKSSNPFEYLRYLCTNLSDGGNFSDFNEQIDALEKKFAKTQRQSTSKKIGKFEIWLHKAIDNTNRIFKLVIGLQWLKTKWTVIFLTGAGLTYWFWQPLWAFIQSFLK